MSAIKTRTVRLKDTPKCRITNYLPCISLDEDYTPSCTSSGRKLQLCKEKQELRLHDIQADRWTYGKGDSYIQKTTTLFAGWVKKTQHENHRYC